MSTTSHYTIRYERDWTWLEFPNWDVHTYDPLTKDTQNAVKEAIKQYCQMRWSRGNKQWYAKAVIPEEKIRRVIEDAREIAMDDSYEFSESNAFDYIPANLNVPNLYGQQSAEDPIVHVKLFGGGSFTWLITEYDPKEDRAFGFCCLDEPNFAELGYVSIAELRELRFPPLGSRVERDIWWKACPLSEAKSREWPDYFGEDAEEPFQSKFYEERAMIAHVTDDNISEAFQKTSQRYRMLQTDEQFVLPLMGVLNILYRDHFTKEQAVALTESAEMHLVNRIMERAEATRWEINRLGPTWNQWQLVSNRKPIDEPLRATRIKAGESIYSDAIVENSEASATAAIVENSEERLEVWKLATDQVYTTLFEFLDQQNDPANEIDALDFAIRVRDKYHVVNDDRGWRTLDVATPFLKKHGWILETYESARPEDWKYLYRAAAPPVDDYQDIQWAQGLTVFAPVVVPDKEDHTLIMLQMIGPAESVKANWAALMSSGAVRYVNSCQIALAGMMDHIGLNIKLPCGHMESWLIHKQASFTEMSPEKGLFYVTSFSAAGDGPPKDMFFAMLDKLLAIPMLADWTDYLWREGEIKDLIIMIEPTHCRGSHAWKVKLDYEVWDTIIKGGVSSGQIKF
jgi:hypothetical protein